MEANINGITNLKIFLRDRYIYVELWPRKKKEKQALVEHFEKLCIREYLKRGDLVFRPEPWSSKDKRTDDINEIVRRARLLVEFLNVNSVKELAKFDELFIKH